MMESRGVSRPRPSSSLLGGVPGRAGSLDQSSVRRRQAYASSRQHQHLSSAPASLQPQTSPAPRSTRTTRQRQREAEIRRLREHTRALSERLLGGHELGVALRQKDRLQLAALIGRLQQEKQALHQYVTASVDSLRRQCDGESVGETALPPGDDVTDCSGLLQQLQQLERLVHEHQRVQAQFADKIAECERLASSMHERNAVSADQLDRRLERCTADNTALGEQSRALRRQVDAIGSTVDSRCDALQTTIGDVHDECRTAHTHVQSLRGKVHSLEHVVAQMRSAGEKRRALLEQQQDARDELRQLVDGKQDQPDGLSHVQQLESKIRELEKRAAAQQLQQEELMLEVAALKRSSSRPISPANHNPSNSQSNHCAGDADDASSLPDLDNNSLELTSSGSPGPARGLPQSGAAPTPLVSAGQLERLMEQLSMDNRLLSELDRSRSRAATTVPLFSSSASASPPPAAALSQQPVTYLQLPAVLQLPDLLAVPGRGSCRVYIARYRYDPLHDSPNAAPEVELPLSAGDYVLVWQWPPVAGGFLHGELLDGRRGLVPSNYVHRLCGSELVEFHQQVVVDSLENCDLAAAVAPLPIDVGYKNAANEMVFQFGGDAVDSHLAQQTTPSQAPPNVMAVEDGDPAVPAPQYLTLERRMSRSVVMGWRAAPAVYAAPPVQSYHVCVDGLLRCSVRAGERLRALLECIDMSRVHRVCVRAVTGSVGSVVAAQHSPDAACTLLIGDGAPVAPACVRAVDVTATAAVITWLPSNSALQHSVCVNNVEVCRLDPGVFRHRITGIVPGTLCRVTVNVHGAAAVGGVQTAGAPLIEFRTPTSCVPEPPLHVQCELGPRHGTLLVTWLPVTIAASGGTSNGAPVTGYAVYADGQRVAELDSPTGDHAVVDLRAIAGFRPRLVTVRTKAAGACVSRDSQPFAVPLHCYDQQPAEYDELAAIPEEGELLRQQQQQQPPDGGAWTERTAGVPHIEITGDSASEGQCSLMGQVAAEEEVAGRRQSRGPVPRSRQQPQSRRRAARGNTRLFVALFDYDPPTMSPNPDACDAELAFCEGQLLRVHGDKDADGFFWGEPVDAGGRAGPGGGLVPCNMVSEVQLQEEDEVPAHSGGQQDRWGDIYCSMPTRRMVALYDYDPRELSPNVDAEVELSFRTGDVILVLGDMDDDGFYMGEIGGARGLVPSNFLTDAPDHYEQQQASGERRAPGAPGPGVHGPPLPPRHRQTAPRQHHQESERHRRLPPQHHHQQHTVDHRSRNK